MDPTTWGPGSTSTVMCVLLSVGVTTSVPPSRQLQEINGLCEWTALQLQV